MSEPTIASKSPFAIDVEKGKTYYFCTCGKSATQPFCDGAHKGSDFSPIAHTPDENKTVYACGCKKSKNLPFCDGTHHDL